MSGIDVSVVASDDDLQRYAALVARAEPDDAFSVEELREHRRRAPTLLYLIAALDGQEVGVAACGEPPGEPRPFSWGVVHVLAGARRRGVGRALAERLLEHARGLGKTELEASARSTEPAGIAFAQAYGLREFARIRELELDLRAEPVPIGRVPGVEVASYAELEGIDRGLYEVAVDAMPDMPAVEPLTAGDFETWASDQLTTIQQEPELTPVARIDGRVVGYGLLRIRSAGRVGRHGGLFVRRDARNRGVAGALKGLQIEAARRRGVELLITQNAESNLAMRRVNERLGYRPRPDRVWMRGSI